MTFPDQQHPLVASEQPGERDLRGLGVVLGRDGGDRLILGDLGRASGERGGEREERDIRDSRSRASSMTGSSWRSMML